FLDPFSRLASYKAFGELRGAFTEAHRKEEFRLEKKGQDAIIRIDAFPDLRLHGHVKTVATVASQQDWLSADVKVYQTMVSIDEPVEDLKPGMSAEVTIFTDDHANHVLTIPVTAIMGNAQMGPKRKCLVKTPTGHEDREIVVGLSNETMAEVKSGLSE